MVGQSSFFKLSIPSHNLRLGLEKSIILILSRDSTLARFVYLAGAFIISKAFSRRRRQASVPRYFTMRNYPSTSLSSSRSRAKFSSAGEDSAGGRIPTGWKWTKFLSRDNRDEAPTRLESTWIDSTHSVSFLPTLLLRASPCFARNPTRPSLQFGSHKLAAIHLALVLKRESRLVGRHER